MAPQNAQVDDFLAEAFACFEQGLCYDDIDDTQNAAGIYERGLNLVKEAEKQKDFKKSEMYKGVMETRKKVESRLKVIKKQKPKDKKGTSESQKEVLDKEKQEKTELREQLESCAAGDAELIFFIPDGVQLFTIEGDETTAPTYPSPLELFRFNPQTQRTANVQADAFIKVGPWTYPLIPGQTPMLKNEFGAYVVPNPTPEHPNMFVGILLPPDLEKQLEADFLNMVKQYSELRTTEVSRSLSQEERKRLSEKIADFIIKGSEKIAGGVNFTAEKTSQMVTDQSSRYRSTLTANEQPMAVNPVVRTGVHYIHRGSKVVAKCTRYLLDKIGDMGVAVGRQLASGAERTFGGGKSGGIVSGTINVIGGGIVGVSTVWIALEDASKTLCRNIANETVDTVKYKYGEDASVTAHKALYATGHSTLAAFQLWDLGPRSIAGRAARKAGVQFVQDLHKRSSSKSQGNEEIVLKKTT